MLTISQEEWLWDLFQTGQNTHATSSWEQDFLKDNEARWSLDHVAYFLSPRMAAIFRKIDDHIAWY